MSDTHAQTASAQADLARADVQDRKPNIPPGHVEDERPARRRGVPRTGPWFGAGLLVIVAAVVLVFVLA